MDNAAQTVATGASKFFVAEWIPLLLDPYTWITLVVSWALVGTIKQSRIIWKRDPQTRRFINRSMAHVVTAICAYYTYTRLIPDIPDPAIMALALGIISPYVNEIVTALLDNFSFTKKVMDAVNPHRRNKDLVPVPKENDDDPTLFMRKKDDE